MIKNDDLDAATNTGIVTQEQADALRRLMAERSAQPGAARVDDESFRFLRGFNDIFISVGILLLGAGLSLISTPLPGVNVIALAIVWGLSEFIVRRRRLALSGMLLACQFSLFFIGIVLTFWNPIAQDLGLPSIVPSSMPILVLFWTSNYTALSLAVMTMPAVCAAAIFYARFRLPFALLLIAGGLVVFVQAELAYFKLFLAPIARSSILLLCGLVIFAAAMIYDFSDRDRVTRRTDCAFWLHLLAAPLIVHSLIELLVGRSMFGLLWIGVTTETSTIVGAIAILTVIALLIDRRALLVSALGYLGIVISYALTQTAEQPTRATAAMAAVATLIILGSLVLMLGFAWQPLRRVFMRLFPAALTDRLPRAILA